MHQQKLLLPERAKSIHENLLDKVSIEIEASENGISFEDFMAMALYHPRLGYYQNELHKIGEKGDFVTAPELGSLFAHGLANSIASLPQDITEQIIELGAGNGSLAADLLRELAKHKRLPSRYFILEPSASLQSLQKENIEKSVPEYIEKVEWLTELPEKFDGVIFGNEVVDAIPCHLIEKGESGWFYLNVVKSKGQSEPNLAAQNEMSQFSFAQGATVADQILPEYLLKADLETGYRTEIRPLVTPWLKGLNQSLNRGVLMLIDYGYPQSEYFHSQRNEGTLRCFSRHLAHSNPLDLVGLQDITAHVDFSALTAQAAKLGLNLIGFTTQAGFLLDNGILDELALVNEEKRFELSQQVQKLITPGQMGEVMKVVAYSKNLEVEMNGFDLQNQCHRL